MRSASAASELSVAGWVIWTSATSSGMRASGAWRISSSASPTSSRARVVARSPSWSAHALTRACSASGRWSTRATACGGGRRRAAGPSSASPRTRGSRPVLTPSATAARAAPVSRRDDGVEERVDRLVALQHAPGRDDLIEGRQRVASRAAALAEHVVDGLLVDVEAGVVGDPRHVLGEDLRRDQVELVVLGPAADRRQDLVRIGRRQHEHDVTGWLLQRLQQRVRRRRRQHVDLVEDVHLRAPGRAQRHLADEVAHRLHAVVRRGVELLEVVGRAGLDGQAALAGAVRFAVLEVLAVQGLGEDARGGGLARPPRTAEQVGVSHPPLPHGVAQRPDDVVLAPHLAEPAWSVAAVEGLVRHRPEPTDRCPPAPGGADVGRSTCAPGDPRATLDAQPHPQVAVGPCATAAREPSQGREAAALSGDCRVPQIAWPPPAGAAAIGGMRERPNRHAWKACVGQPTVGSNPTPSATAGRSCSVPALGVGTPDVA